MEVRHEPPSAETQFRLKAPLTVGFADGTAVRVDDWSLRALYSRELDGRRLDGLMLSIPFQGVGVYFPIELEPGDAPHEYLFRNLTGRQREALALFYRNLLSGRMTSTGDMIVALDTPVDLVPMGETATERREGERQLPPRKARILVNLAYYGALFLLVAGFLASVAWNRVSYVPVLSSQVAAATGQIVAPVAGYVREIGVPAGSTVEGGTVVLRLDDQEALRMLAEVETALVEAAQLQAAAEARLAAHAAQRDAARETFRGGPERFDEGVSVNTGDYHDIRLKLEADVQRLKDEQDRLAARLGTLRERAEATVLTVPGRATLLEHRVRPFDLVRAGDALAVYELHEPRSIVAHLPATSVLKVWPGMRADVTYMTDGQAIGLVGQVQRIVVDGKGPEQLLALTITVPGLGVEDSRRLFTDGMPVHVVLRPEHLTRWFRSLRS